MKQSIKITTTDGLSLDGLLEKPDSISESCVILCHGLSVDKEELGIFTKLAKTISDAGFHTFRFDFRGCGQSDGDNTDFTIAGGLTDLKSTVAFLKSLSYRSFIVLAASFSGGIVSLYSGKNPVGLRGLVMWNALIDYEEKKNPTTERNKKAWGQSAIDNIIKYGYVERSNGFRIGKKLIEEVFLIKPWQDLIKYNGPVVFIHGTADVFVPHIYSQKYSEQMDNAELILIDKAEHGFHKNEGHYKKAESAVLNFIKEILWQK